MPVTIRIASVFPDEQRYRSPDGTPTAESVLKTVWKPKGIECKEMLQSSYEPVRGYTPNRNGFVKSVIQAYNTHQNLIIRPDDIWVSIMCQLNLYVNAHAEEMRPFFVQHQGQKELLVVAMGNRYSVDFGAMTQCMSEQLKEHINDPLLHDFIMPNFSTTTDNDKVICSVMMMSALKAFFRYTMMTLCGIPSITLLGEKSDYQSLLVRLDKLATLGREPHTLARFLRPILMHFVNVFEAPPDMNFWTKICHYKSGSGAVYIGGWISAFCVWGADGKWLGPDIEKMDDPITEQEEIYAASYEAMASRTKSYQRLPVLVMDGIRYPVVDTADVADGFCQVDVRLNDNGEIFPCMMVAGHVGYALLDDLEPDATSGIVKRNTLQPMPQWFLFVKGEA